MRRSPAIEPPRSILKLASLAFTLTAAAAAQVSQNGPEFQVNTYTTNYQAWPAVTVDAAGNFVVVWESEGSGGTDTSLYSIQGQRYNAAGSPVGNQFQVNSFTTSNQQHSAVAADSAGNFVVVWESNGSSGTDASGLSIQAQRYDAAGAPLGGQFQVNSYTFNKQGSPSVAVDDSGKLVVVWTSFSSNGTDPSWSVQAQRYDAAGTPIGNEFQVNTYTTSTQGGPAVAASGSGSFVVVWSSDGSSGTDTSGLSIQAQRYDAAGTPVGNQFQVNTYTTADQVASAVAVDDSGSFVVTWESDGSSGTDTSYWSIQAQRYDAAGNPLGSQFQVNSFTTDDQQEPAVATDSAGNFVVTWHSPSSSGTDTSGWSIQAQRYHTDGTPHGDQFQINTYTTGNQLLPSIGADDSGNLVVVWNSDGSTETDTSGWSIQAQRYDGLFRDGFESGDASRWSSVGQ